MNNMTLEQARAIAQRWTDLRTSDQERGFEIDLVTYIYGAICDAAHLQPDGRTAAEWSECDGVPC